VFSSKNWRCYEQRGEARNATPQDDSRQTLELRRGSATILVIAEGPPKLELGWVAIVVHCVATTRTLHEGECTLPAASAKEACWL
jgi:hypothetical protein